MFSPERGLQIHIGRQWRNFVPYPCHSVVSVTLRVQTSRLKVLTCSFPVLQRYRLAFRRVILLRKKFSTKS